MTNFKIGDEVVCVKVGDWKNRHTGQLEIGPSKGDTLTVSSINNNGYLCFQAYPNSCYKMTEFVKLNRPQKIQYVKQEIKIEEPILN